MPDCQPGPQLGVLRALYRYPVKSLTGETLDRVRIDGRGLVGDRLWSVRDTGGKFGSGKSTRRFRRMNRLLSLAAHYDGDLPLIEFPDGRRHRADDSALHDALSVHVGRTVRVGREDGTSHFDEGPIHLLTSAALHELAAAHTKAVEVRRLRPNLVVDTPERLGFVEHGWIGRRVGIGSDVVLLIRATMPRCVMLNLPQTGLAADPELLNTATRASGADVGVVADVLSTGIVALGDPVCFVD
jgi:uncharacterized protein YcbX